MRRRTPLSPPPPPPPPPVVAGNQLRIPANVRLRGANIVCSVEQKTGLDWNDEWVWLWRAFDWNNWWRPQIDDAAAVGNAVRLFGCPKAIAVGVIDQGTYLARWEQVLDYVAAKNLYAYPCGGDLGHWGEMPDSQAIDLYGAWADLLKKYTNVIGVEITSEALSAMATPQAGMPSDPLATLKSLTDTVRAHSGLAVTHSMSLTDPGLWTWDGGGIYPLPQLFEMSDFLDYHVYCTTTPQAAAQAFTTPWGQGKQMVVGEFGCNLTISSKARRATYKQMHDIVASDNRFAGALAWSCWDPSNTTDSQYGLYDVKRRLRTDISVPFATIPVCIPKVVWFLDPPWDK